MEQATSAVAVPSEYEVFKICNAKYGKGYTLGVAESSYLLWGKDFACRYIPRTFRATDGRLYYYDRYSGTVMTGPSVRGTTYRAVVLCDDERVAAYERRKYGKFTWATFSDGSWVVVQKDSTLDAAGKEVRVVKRDKTSKLVVLGAKVGTVYGCAAYAVGPAPSPDDTDHATADVAAQKDEARRISKETPARKYRGQCGCGESAYFLDARNQPICDDCRSEDRHGWMHGDY